MMLQEVLHGLVCAVFLSPIYCSSTATWTKQDNLQASFFNAPVSNILRCGKLCEKQEKCIAASFDVARGNCYLHETPVPVASNNSKGKYLVRNVKNATKEMSSCNSAQLSVPSVGPNGENCLEMNEEQTTTQTTEPPTTSPACLDLCQFDQPINETTCLCMCGDGFKGRDCENPPRDVSDFSSDGYKWIYSLETNEKIRAVRSGGMMYILMFNESYGAFESYKNSSWNAFKSGINNYGYKYWIGNNFVHTITTQNNHSYSIKAYVRRYPYWLTSEYFNFVMEDEASNFTIHFSHSTVNPNGEPVFFNNTQFRTTDYNSNECTSMYNSAWWYDESCSLPSPLSGNHSVLGELTDIYDFVLNLNDCK